MDAEHILAWATLAVAVISIINAATEHYSEVDGPWYTKLLRTLLWLTEKISVLGSRGTGTVWKVPLTDSKLKTDDDGSTDVILAFVFSAVAIILLAALAGGCGSTLKAVDTTQRVVEASAGLTDVMCEPVETICKARKEWPDCSAYGSCLKARVIAAKSLKSANGALQLAALAAIASDSGEVERWTNLAVEAIREAQKQIAIWRATE